MQRNIIETIMGAVVMIVAIFFVVFAFTSSEVGTVSGYQVIAHFENASGITPGTDVRLSGVKVGTVTKQQLDREKFTAVITMAIEDDILLPTDTSARILPDGLLGNNYVELEPGGDVDNIPPDGQIVYTQGSINLVDLAVRLFISSTDDSGDGGAAQ